METTIPMPENAIVVTTQNGGDNLGFTVGQEWVDKAGMAVRIGMNDCIVKGNITLGSKEDFEGECIAGITSVTVVLFFDSQFDPLECEACNYEDLTGMGETYNSCAYSVEIPCDPIAVECGEPSAAPSGTISPSESPVVEKTRSPTETPSTVPPEEAVKEPTTSPRFITKSPVVFPPVCDKDVVEIKRVGTTDISLHKNDAIRIISQDRTTVTVKLNQAWESPGDEEIPIDHIFYAFRPDNFNEKCYEEVQVMENTVYGTITIQCAVTKPYALLEICIADDITNEKLIWNGDEENATVPKCCHPSFPPETPVVCYTVEISCVTECVEEQIARGRSLLRGLK